MEEYSRLNNQLNSANMVSYSYSTNSKYNNNPQSINNQIFFSSLNQQSHLNITRTNHFKDNQIIEEAKLLREHEYRLETRMKVLENHNKLLDSQLKQLRNLLNTVTKKNKLANELVFIFLLLLAKGTNIKILNDDRFNHIKSQVDR